MPAMAGGRADSGHALPAGRGFTKQLSSAIICGAGAPGVPAARPARALPDPGKTLYYNDVEPAGGG